MIEFFFCPVSGSFLRPATPDGLVPGNAAPAYPLYGVGWLARQIWQLSVERQKIEIKQRPISDHESTRQEYMEAASPQQRRSIRTDRHHGIAITIALTAYLIAPDPTPDANRMIVEIGPDASRALHNFFYA